MPEELNRTEIGRDLVTLLRDINEQTRVVKDEAYAMGIAPYLLRDYQGNAKLAPLLAAKAQTLHALVLINQKGN